MPIFTYTATAIVGLVTGAGFTATAAAAAVAWSTTAIAVSLVASGLAIGTAKLLGVFKPPSLGNQKDPGVKIQLGPSTDNKVPRLYGRNYTGGIVIDAEIKNENKRMAYALVLSEYSPNDTWSINKIYRGDNELVFGYAGANNCIVSSVIDPNATASTKVGIDTGKKSKYPQGRFRVRVYAGGSESTNQIFPTTNKVAAYGTGLCQFTNWSSANTMEDLVFAIVEMDYDPENDFVGLGAITFDLNNSLNEPSNVLLDYLRNDRYGAGLSNTVIDTASFNSWYDYATEQVNYIDQSNVTQQHDRYQIDGALSTFATVNDNIGKICLSGGAFFTYNAKQGKFGVVVNRAATAGEKANAFVFNDDNVLGSISITSTDLYSLYNQIEVEYASVNQRDQTDTYFAECNVSIRNTNEPDNPLKYRLEMVNDRSRVSQLANIDLNQSRLSMIIELTADHSSMVVDVGDVVKLTSELYGFEEKLFRCMRAIETEGEDGILTFKFTLLEYDDDVYGDLLTQEDLPPPVTGITNWWVLNSNAVLSIGNILVVSDPTQPTANLYAPDTGSVAGTANLDTVRATFGGAYSSGTFINVPIGVPVNVNYDEAVVQVYNDAANTSPPATYTRRPESSVYFTDDETFNFTIDTYNFNKDTEFHLEIQMRNTQSGAASRTYVTAGLNNPRANVITGDDIQSNTVTSDNFFIFAPGAQIQDAGLNNYSPTFNSTIAWHQLTTPVEYDLRDAEANVDYSVDAVAGIVGSLPPVSGSGGTYSIGFRIRANVTYQYSSNTTTYIYEYYPATSTFGGTDPYPPTAFIPAGGVITMNPGEFVGGDDNGLLVSANIWLEGYNNLGAAIAGRGFDDMKYQLLKINKGIRN